MITFQPLNIPGQRQAVSQARPECVEKSVLDFYHFHTYISQLLTVENYSGHGLPSPVMNYRNIDNCSTNIVRISNETYVGGASTTKNNHGNRF